MRNRIGNHTGSLSRRLLALLAVLMLALAACAGGETDTDTGETGETETEATEDDATDEESPAEAEGDAEDADESADAPERMALAEFQDEYGAVPEPSEDYRLAAVLKTLINEHWQQMRQGYLDAAEEHGIEVVVQAAEDESDLTGQLAIAETLFGQGFDAFSVSPLSQSNLDPVLSQIRDADMPLINVDDARVDARTFVGADHQEMGVLAAETIAEMLPEGGKVAQIEGQAGSPAAQQRIDGYDSVMDGREGFDYVASVPGDWDRQTALDAATNIIEQHPDIAAFYANNDTMALGVVEAVRNAGKTGEIIVIGTDGIPGAMDAIRDGGLTGTVAVKPYQMGTTAVEVAIRLLEGQAVPEWVVTEQVMVTSDNIEEFTS